MVYTKKTGLYLIKEVLRSGSKYSEMLRILFGRFSLTCVSVNPVYDQFRKVKCFKRKEEQRVAVSV